MRLPFHDRRDAGQRLAQALRHYAHRADVVVLALPRGGVPVGFEVARALGAELDLLLVRKLGAPGQPELAIGAIASGGMTVMNAEIVDTLDVGPDAIAAIKAREARELERRERAYRGERHRPQLDGRTVIIVDDGIATGATLRAAIGALRSQAPARIVVAAPVAPADTIATLEREADEVVCLATPSWFGAISQFYVDFAQTDDEEVRALLGQAWAPKTAVRAAPD
jgi:predicted phosphoribosyltransferase